MAVNVVGARVSADGVRPLLRERTRQLLFTGGDVGTKPSTAYTSLSVGKGRRISTSKPTTVVASISCGWPEHGATELGTVSKPGILSEAPSGVFGRFYAILAS